ncbi:hypothetical protein CDD82_950 [Ophiocordyceps australis]|uniref:Uncharacterized protein n=1 Tax=Ophiocordyceps australis TaxID=1399860 RepID=A0A2C5YM19_9HYPO|nr:hypothetical protein CDD82_950 [Ophiocordyceps australis]
MPSLGPMLTQDTPSQSSPESVSPSFPSASLSTATAPMAPISPPRRAPAPPLLDGHRRRKPPAKGSINDLLRQHSRSSLFLRPIHWTDRHVHLLGAQFRELPRCHRPAPSNMPAEATQGNLRPGRTAKVLCDALTEILQTESPHPITTSNAIKLVFSIFWPRLFKDASISPEMHLYFSHRMYRDAVRTQVMWHYTDDLWHKTFPALDHANRSYPPTMCYISKTHLAYMRANLFRIILGPGKTTNLPVSNLQQAKYRTLQPANTDHDAQFVAIFLAMAQRHFHAATTDNVWRRESSWWQPKRRLPNLGLRDLKLRILTHDNETCEFIVYTAKVTAKFLARFHYPAKAPRDKHGRVAGLKIGYTRVPIWPILGLYERLGQALGEDLVGPVDATRMETWTTDSEEDDSFDSNKRKRDTLSDVLNTSFEDTEESEDESERVPTKKPCLSESSPVGVVG